MEKIKGKAHQQTFVVSCTVSGTDSRSTGTGGSRRDAEQQAAERMLAMLVAEQ
jgi:ribonuclease-3